MIIRKPYAFLIKHFRKIHIGLLIIGIYVFYKTIDVARFVNEFMSYGVYDLYRDPITKHITALMTIAVLLMIAGSVALGLLLRHKKKPWKAYIMPAAIYLLLFLTLGMIKSFFRSYTEIVDTANLRLSRDLLLIFMFAELPALAIFVGRIFGIDLKKFHFNLDLQELELKEEDRAEIEIGLNIDHYTFIRWGRKIWRHIGYFYKEHKKISYLLITLFSAFLLYKSYLNIYVYNRVYHEGQVYNINGYSITVNNSYFTNKDGEGNVISKDSNFVIVEVEVKNNRESRSFDITKFHLKAGTKDYTTTETTYAKEFADLGTSYSKVRKIKKDETIHFIVIYKVDKKIRKGKFILYYQEQSGIYKLRKIKLSLKDLSNMAKVKNLALGDLLDINIKDKEDSLSFESYEITNSVSYKINKCTSVDCDIETKNYTAPDGYRILTLSFASDLYEAKNVIDFLLNYGKINYKDNEDNDRKIDIDIAVNQNYFGKEVYLKIPLEAAFSTDLSLDIVIRNQETIYKII